MFHSIFFHEANIKLLAYQQHSVIDYDYKPETKYLLMGIATGFIRFYFCSVKIIHPN